MNQSGLKATITNILSLVKSTTEVIFLNPIPHSIRNKKVRIVTLFFVLVARRSS